MPIANPTGIPRLDREEPEQADEEDIPTASDEDKEVPERSVDVPADRP